MSRLFILGIAINEYPNPKHRLSGCVNDRDAFLNYLQAQYTEMFDSVSVLTLTNEEATRNAIIKAFEHFHQADNDDTNVLFYAGHGSQIPAPKTLGHLESDDKLETIVCYDSRTPGGADLLDKELSYLIWEATAKREKSPHFALIMDCCHSSTNTRTELSNGIKERRIREVSGPSILRKFWVLTTSIKTRKDVYFLPGLNIYCSLLLNPTKQPRKLDFRMARMGEHSPTVCYKPWKARLTNQATKC